MSGTEKDEVLKGLERDLDMWDRYCFISHHGALAANLIWAGVVLRACLASDAEVFKKAVLGLLAALRPWTAWVFKALELNAGFEIDRTVLLISGIAFGLTVIDQFFSHSAQRAWERLEDASDALERGKDTWLDPYAAEHPSEFFAVVSEAFFENPAETQRRYPAVYEQLRLFYRQDPARRLA